MGDRKGSPLLYHESARQACGEACASPGWCGQSLSAYGRRKRPHPTQLFPRPYGFEGSSEGMSYHTYRCKSTTAPTRKRGFFLLNLTPFGRNELRPYICWSLFSSLSVYFGMAHGKVGAASCSKRYKYLHAVYIEVGHVYALFMFYRLHFHQKLVARFTHPETVTHL